MQEVGAESERNRVNRSYSISDIEGLEVLA